MKITGIETFIVPLSGAAGLLITHHRDDHFYLCHHSSMDLTLNKNAESTVTHIP